MQQKHQFIRKPRKLLSKDKLINFNQVQNGISKHKSKDGQQKKITNQISPNKPYNLISNLRFQLTNLRQQVSKLSKKQNKQNNNQNQIRLEYRSSKDKHDINAYYFDKKGNQNTTDRRPNSKTKLKTYSTSQVSQINIQHPSSIIKKNTQHSQIEQMKIKIQQIEQKNSILIKSNQDMQIKMKQMAQRFKEQYQFKIKQIQNQKQVKQRQTKIKNQSQNDITINYHKKYIQNKQYIQIINKKLQNVQVQNQKLKLMLQKSKKYQSALSQKQSELMQRQKLIQKFKQALQQLKQQKQELNKAKQSYQAQIKRLKNIINQHIDIIAKNKDKITGLQSGNKQLEKNNQFCLKNLSQMRDKYNKIVSQLDSIKYQYQHQLKLKPKIQIQNKKKPKSSSSLSSSSSVSSLSSIPSSISSKIQHKADNKQLYDIITLQQKSIKNQQSDINYLQTQLRKLHYLKIVNKNQHDMIEGLNQQIVNNQLQILNKKYKVMYL